MSYSIGYLGEVIAKKKKYPPLTDEQREIQREYRRIYRWTFPEVAQRIARKHAQTPKWKASCKKWRLKAREHLREWGKRHQPISNANWNKYVKTPRGKAWKAQRDAARRARIKRATIDKSARAVVVEISTALILSCTWCGKLLRRGERSIDHIIALALGGHHIADNLTCSCWLCNSRKRSKPIEQWLTEL